MLSNVALIDADIVAYRAAASCKGDDPSEIACIRADKTIRSILQNLDAPDYWLFLSGSTNFRYDLYPEYKANRKDLPRPKYLQIVREYLVLDWDANVTDGYEADDAIGIKHTDLTRVKFNPIICSIDKDFKQFAGQHYNFVKEELNEISSHDALVNFYNQLLLGDKGDNIPGFDGVPRAKATKFIEARIDLIWRAETELEMFDLVEEIYEDELDRNANLLYIWRKECDKWERPHGN